MTENSSPTEPTPPVADTAAHSTTPAPVAPAVVPQQTFVPVTVQPKNPGIALVASFFIVGLGQLINGQVGKGIAFFVSAIVSAFLMFLIIGFVTTPILWIWSMADAYQSAKKWNLAHGVIS